MTHVVQAVFPSLPEVAGVIKNLTWPKTYRFFTKALAYTFSINSGHKNKMCVWESFASCNR